MTFSPIKNERLSDKIVRAIMERIKDGILKPGEKLPNELELAEALCVSRGVLREALTILQARGYLLRKPREGTFINPDVLDIMNNSMAITLKEGTYKDLIEMRICLEQRIVEKIIDTATDDEIAELFDLINIEDVEEGTHSVDYYFHYRLAELSRNAMFVNFIDSYYDVISEVATHTMKNIKRKEDNYQEHLDIVQAIQKRDKQKAKDTIVHHLEMVLKHIKLAE